MKNTGYNFLHGGGEMGELTRNYDWSKTPLGSPDQWPQSLRTTVSILLNSQFPMFVWWGNGLTTIYNDSYKIIAGDKHPDLLGKSGCDAWEEIWVDLSPLVDKVFNGISTWSEDLMLNIKRNGFIEETYFTFSYSPVLNESGKVGGLFCACIETTEKVVGKKKLEESGHQVRSIIDSAPFPIGVFTGKEMRIQFVNQALLDGWGKGDNVVGKLFREVLPELSEEIFEQSEAVYTTGIPYHTKNQRVDVVIDGNPKPYYYNYSFIPLFNGEGKVNGVMNTAVDVTDLNLAHQKVEESERNLRNTILQAPVAVCILRGSNASIEIANQFMVELLGKPAERLIGQSLFAAVAEVKDVGLEELLEQVRSTGVTYKANEAPFSLLRNNVWEKIYVNFVYEPYREEDGSISGVIVVAIDVTQQVVARQGIEAVVIERTKELAKVNRQLQQNNNELKQFAYIASHDLQEPVRKVTTFTQLLEKSLGPVDPRSKSYLDKIYSSSKRMLALIRDVLAFSQLSHESEKFKQVDLTEVLENIKSDFELLIEEKQAKINYTSLPVITAIPFQMNQLFSNLISNALKFSKKDVAPVINITAHITVREQLLKHAELNQSIEYYTVRVSDNGIGFDQQYADKIFDIFQRLHPKTDYEGTGIGLALCKKIAMNHNGNLLATSSLNNGATFEIFLPNEQSKKLF